MELPTTGERLPRRLRRVLALVLEGHRNRAIAQTLGLAEHTVENYMTEILESLHCSSRAELIIRCWQSRDDRDDRRKLHT